MYCKHCGAEVEPEQKVCPGCGADVKEKAIALSKGAKMAVSIIACVLLVLSLALLVFTGAGGKLEDIPKFFVSLFTPKENNLFYKSSYTVEDGKVGETAGKVVATLGEHTLTNAQLQVFYWVQVYDFIEQTGGYTSYYGLDLSKPFDQQPYDTETGKNWQQALLENALKAWTKYVLIADEAQKNNFVLPEDYQKTLDEVEANETKNALDNGFASADEALQAEFGKGVTVADYKHYLSLFFTSNLYLDHVVEQMEITEEELENYYTENKSSMDYYGITKEIGNMTDVRHLLVSLEKIAGEKKTEYTPAEWEACRQKAQQLLDQWVNGEKTEKSFIKLVTEHSDDTYSVPDGGLISYVYKNGQYVEEFEAWCIDTTRAKGDYDLVKTSYGYHLMYCVETETAWVRACSDTIKNNRIKEMWGQFNAEADIDYKNIAIANVSLTKA